MAKVEKFELDKNGVYKFFVVIKDFTENTGNSDPEPYKIDVKLAQATNWSLRIYPNGEKPENRGHLSVLLRFICETRSTIRTFFACSIINKYKEKWARKSMTHLFKNEEDFGWPSFISKRNLFEYRKKFAGNDILTLCFEIQPHLIKFDPDSVSKDPVYSLKPGTRQKLFTDLTVKVKGKQIKAHKVYLAEASEKFFEMISKNQKKNVLELKDLDAKIAEKMIEFIYEDKIEGIGDEANELLIAADEYKMDRLKKYCEKYLWESLTAENVIETLRFAAGNGCDELKTECIEFMARHISEVPRTNWAIFIAEFPTLFAKLFRRFVILNHEKIEPQFRNLPDLKQYKAEFKQREAAQDFHHLYMDKNTSDVKLKIGGKFLLAHKAVLSSFSDVFKAMFEHDTKESQESQVIIMDFDMKTMREVLRYIYCGKVLGLTTWALYLLPAADYYNLSELAENCEKSLMVNLEFDNLADVYEVANLNSRLQLKQRILAYFWKDILELMQSENWCELIEGKPDFINCIFKDFIKIVYPSAPNSSDNQKAGPSNPQRAKPAQSEDSDDEDEEEDD